MSFTGHWLRDLNIFSFPKIMAWSLQRVTEVLGRCTHSVTAPLTCNRKVNKSQSVSSLFVVDTAIVHFLLY